MDQTDTKQGGRKSRLEDFLGNRQPGAAQAAKNEFKAVMKLLVSLLPSAPQESERGALGGRRAGKTAGGKPTPKEAVMELLDNDTEPQANKVAILHKFHESKLYRALRYFIKNGHMLFMPGLRDRQLAAQLTQIYDINKAIQRKLATKGGKASKSGKRKPRSGAVMIRAVRNTGGTGKVKQSQATEKAVGFEIKHLDELDPCRIEIVNGLPKRIVNIRRCNAKTAARLLNVPEYVFWRAFRESGIEAEHAKPSKHKNQSKIYRQFNYAELLKIKPIAQNMIPAEDAMITLGIPYHQRRRFYNLMKYAKINAKKRSFKTGYKALADCGWKYAGKKPRSSYLLTRDAIENMKSLMLDMPEIQRNGYF